MKTPKIIACVLVAVAGTLNAQPTSIESVALARQSNLHYRNFSYWGKDVQWPSPRIAVCWENPSQADEQERKWARDAVIRTWEKESAVRFDGWGPCDQGTKGVRIRIADEWPQTTNLGKRLDGVQNGVTLNFAFQFNDAWKNDCADRKRCIELTTIHELGHALGLAHEQARDDMPPEVKERCKKENRDASAFFAIGDWDPKSVMNYCNKEWINNGQLSLLDIQGVRLIYGTP